MVIACVAGAHTMEGGEVMIPMNIFGDPHGRPDVVWEVIQNTQTGSINICLGDFGIGFYDCYCSEEKFFDYIAEQDTTILFIDGNHENFSKLNSLPVSTWNGGKVHMIRHNLIHLMRGEVYDIDGKRFFTFGGGYSLDRERRTEGVDWWPEENIQEEDRKNAEKNLNECNHKVDYCITHTAPIDTVGRLAYNHPGVINKKVMEEFEMTNYLQLIADTTEFSKWYFGHFHVDDERLWQNQYAVMYDVREIETGDVIYTRTRGIIGSTYDIVYIKDEWV